MVNIQTLLDEKINSDSAFQATLVDMSEEDKAQAVANKKTELLDSEFTSLSEKAAKAEELAKNQKIRAEKAEQEAKKNKPAGESEAPKLSDEEVALKYARDAKALSDIHEEDVEWFANWAKFNKVDLATAKKDKTAQAVLRLREEERATAAATNTGGGKKTTSQNTPEAILERAAEGQFPEDDEGIKALAEARLQAKLAKIKT